MTHRSELDQRSRVVTIVKHAVAIIGLVALGVVDLGCSSATATKQSLILISVDGFRWDYIDKQNTPNLARLAAQGVRAEGLIPVYPTKTFPCHYSIVTGLYPGNHGIISNNILDREMNAEFHLADRISLLDPRWWGGEPIWATAEKQGLVTATMFWPGSELEIGGVRPTFWFHYDPTITFEERVEQVLEWLDLPAAERPRLITLYFEEPNEASHEYGPESQQTWRVNQELDARIGDLVDGLRQRGLRNQVNLIVVSDHGFAETDPNRIVLLDDYVELEEGEVFELGAILQIFPKAGRRELIYEALKGAHPNLAIYLSEEIPDRYHLKQNPRTPPILGVPDAGWEVVTRRYWEDHEADFTKGDHGQDPLNPILHGIFVANGPVFRSGLTIERFELVEIYNLMTSVLELEPAPNDGESGKLDAILE